MMKSKKIYQIGLVCLLASSIFGCVPKLTTNKPEFASTPDSYSDNKDSVNDANTSWKKIFTDSNLVRLIDTAIKNNPEANVALQEIIIASNEVKMRKSLLSPMVNAYSSIGMDKAGRYTSEGAGNASTDITPGRRVPEPLNNFNPGFQASWEADIWHKIRYSKQSALQRYLASIEGKNFITSNLVAEIANSYYELLALDNQLSIIKESIELQKKELEIVKLQKEAARATELAVKQFEAQVYYTESLENDVIQQITENENKINLLSGKFNQPIKRDTSIFLNQEPLIIKTGVPAQLILNRPDIKQAEHEMNAAGLDVKVARAEFLPELGFESGLGYSAFKPGLLFSTPESIMFSLFGKLTGPVFNRVALKAEYANANARQIQSLYNYQNSILNGYAEVSNQMNSVKNLDKIYKLKYKQVATLNTSIDIAHDLFLSARADYLEVLTAQKEALQSKLELNEVRKNKFNSTINLYRALGGGWK